MPGSHGRRAEIEHGRAGGNLHPERLPRCARPDDDDLVGEHPAQSGIEQRPTRIATTWFGGAQNFRASETPRVFLQFL